MDFSIELQSSAGELRPQHNKPGETSTRENALEYDPDECTLINIRIETAQYGVYDGEAAALIIFRFYFKFRTGFQSKYLLIEVRQLSGGVRPTLPPAST
jgi:hypothetical protein